MAYIFITIFISKLVEMACLLGIQNEIQAVFVYFKLAVPQLDNLDIPCNLVFFANTPLKYEDLSRVLRSTS